MKFRHCLFLLLAATPLGAQQPQRALPVEDDPVLRPDAGNDFLQRARNLYDAAQRSTDLESRRMQFERSAELFTQYLSVFPNHPNAEMAWWYLGNSHYQSGHMDEARRAFHMLLNQYREGRWAAAAAYTLAADHYNKGEYAFAAPLFERYAANAARPEERPRGHFFAGNSYRMLNRDREATLAFRRVIEDPAGAVFAPQATVSLGHLALRGGRLEEALEEFEKVIPREGTAPAVRGEAALHGALTATKLDRTELSDQYLRLILSTPGMEDFRAEAQTALMANLFARGEYRQVVEAFRRSSIKAEGLKEAARLMIAARAYMRLSQFAEASTLFREVEQLAPPEHDLSFEASYFRLLCFYEIEGRHVPDQVDAFLQIYRRTRPNDARIHTALMMKAESHFSNGEIEDAAKAYGEVDATLVSEANLPGLLFQRGWCLAETGDHAGAIRSLSEFVTRFPQDERLLSALAKRAAALVESGEPARAIADFDRIATSEDATEGLVSFAWLESARLRRTSGEIDDMVLRYRGLLAHVANLRDPLEAEANYWIGWGLVKGNDSPAAVPYLEKARILRPEAYAKHAGILLTLGYFAAQDAEKLAVELHRAIEDGYAVDIPDQAIRWSGMQQYNNGDHEAAARFLGVVANPAEPRETPKEVWRYLAKSLLEIGEGEGALTAADNVLEVEEHPGWQADGLLDKARALHLLGRSEEARAIADEAFALRPQGRTNAGLRILSGDLRLEEGDAEAASAEYLIVIQTHEDRDLRPLAMHKLLSILRQQDKAGEAAELHATLVREYPDWKAPD